MSIDDKNLVYAPGAVALADTMDDVAVVVVTWNAAETIDDCLRSVLAPGATGLAVVVADNASSDGTPERVRDLARTDPRLRLLPMGRNAGFGAACNAGASIADRPLALFLNPDARLQPGALARMVGRMRVDPSIAVAGAWSCDAHGVPWLEAGRLPDVWREAVDKVRYALRGRIARAPADEGGDVEVEWVSGACMLVRHAAIPGATLFDERYFLYFEDKDLCARARAATGRVVVVGGARLVHVGGASARKAGERTAVAYRESQLRYYAKHRGPVELFVLRVVLTLAFVARAALSLVLPRATRFGPRLAFRLVGVLWRDAAAPTLVGDPGAGP